MKTSICTLSALAIASSLAFAQDKPVGPHQGHGAPNSPLHPHPEEVFKKLDASADGSLGSEEFKASPIGQKDAAKAAEIFKQIDANGDGSVTLAEFKAHRPPHAPGGPTGPNSTGGAPAPHAPPHAPPHTAAPAAPAAPVE